MTPKPSDDLAAIRTLLGDIDPDFPLNGYEVVLVSAVKALIAKAEARDETIRQLKEKLRAYGQHRSGCAILGRHSYTHPSAPIGIVLPPVGTLCNCGLMAALAATDATESKP